MMLYENTNEQLCENLKLLNKNALKLIKSLNKAITINLNRNIDQLSENETEILETLANRFNRTVNILIDKVLRNLDILELEDIFSTLDIIMRTEKRGIVDNFKTLVQIKNLRNQFIQEDVEEDLIPIFKEIIEKTPKLLQIIENVNSYIESKGFC
jgi:Rad3-related DNA helicase